MAKRTIQVKGITINVDERDYISVSDICAGFEAGTALIQTWMRTRSTVEFLGVWERLFNEGFNSVEFDRIKNEAGTNTFILSVKKWAETTGAIGITAEQWRTTNPGSRGNIRDHASIIELHVLANMESYNAILLRNGLNQWQRINELTRTAVEQMKIFEETNIAAIRRLKNADIKQTPPGKELSDNLSE